MARPLYVQSLPEEGKASKFQQHQEAVRQDVIKKLRALGVDVTESFSASPSPPAVLVLFQSTGRVGDELPAALATLDSTVKEHVDILAVIQDSPHSRVGKEALPAGFQPRHLVDLVVVPGTSRLRQCPQNDDALNGVASVVGVDHQPGVPWGVVLALIVVGLGMIAYFYRGGSRN